MTFAYRVLTALAVLALAGVGLTALSQPQQQPLMFHNLTDNPHQGGQLLPVMFDNQPAAEGWVIQIICDGAEDGVDPPISSGPQAGMPSDDDFLADSTQNLVSYWRINGQSVMGEHYAGIFLPFQYLLCLEEGAGTEPVINVGDRIYLRVFDAEHWSTATRYVDMTAVYQAVYTTGLPETVYGAEFSPLGVNPVDGGVVVTEWKLHQNYPNPFNPLTTITYDVLNKGRVYLSVYNVTGQEVARLMEGQTLPNGRYTASWDARDFSSGVYFYRIRVEAEEGGTFKFVRKLALVK